MLTAEEVSVEFGSRQLFHNLCLKVQDREIVTILGPNGSGKSTLLKVFARMISPQTGAIFLDGKKLQTMNPRELAQCMAVLPQSPVAPGDVTVRSLVGYGRFPHQRWWKNTRSDDEKSIEWALTKTGLEPLADRTVSTLSGGERQRVWLAMALAQKPQILLLDEPTTYLDISHQLEILDLIAQLNRDEKITVLMVLHELNHAARYSDQVAVLTKGKLYAVGTPAEVIQAKMLRDVFRVEADVWYDEAGRPITLARSLVKEGDLHD